MKVSSELKAYRGIKRILAVPAERYGKAGYLVRYEDGYESWSPKKAFEEAYRSTEAMGFEGALMALKEGKKVARAGWNGKGMWVALTPDSAFDACHARPGHAAAHRAEELRRQGSVELLPHIDMRTADGTICVGWLASQSDMLAEDWMELD